MYRSIEDSSILPTYLFVVHERESVDLVCFFIVELLHFTIQEMFSRIYICIVGLFHI